MKIQCTLSEFYNLVVKVHNDVENCEACPFEQPCAEIKLMSISEDSCNDFLAGVVEIKEV